MLHNLSGQPVFPKKRLHCFRYTVTVNPSSIDRAQRKSSLPMSRCPTAGLGEGVRGGWRDRRGTDREEGTGRRGDEREDEGD